jgi:tetratricopeptide (TPR) repeat protein
VTCDEIERDELAEQYLLGRLPEEASAEFEAHYFDCERCLERVELLERTRAHLVSSATGNVPRRRFRYVSGGLAAAAVLLLAVALIREFPSPAVPATPSARDIELPASPQSPAVADAVDRRRLGAIDPPRFDAPRLRSSPTPPRRLFLDAMRLYERGDYAGAIPGLQRAAEQDATVPQSHFFLAVCYLQLDRNGEAVEHLRRTIRRGESPYLEDARFLLAKAHIRQGDFESARNELRAVIAMDGDRRVEAGRLQAQLR